MAKLTFILNRQRPNKDGRYPVMLRINTSSSKTAVSCNIYVQENAFCGEPEKVVSRTIVNAKRINSDLSNLYYTYVNAINELTRLGKLPAMSATDIRNYVEMHKEYHTECTFTSSMLEYQKNSRTEKTKSTFDYTIKKLSQFSGKEKLFFEEINYKFLTDFDRWMENNNIGMASRGIVFRNIRTIFNYAINNDWVNASQYPFRKFKIKQARKEKVFLPEDKMQALLSLNFTGMQGEEGLTTARDFFLLSFMFCGINPIDLYNLPPSEKKISFVRTKVRFHEPQPIHIHFQPETEYLINEHKGNAYLLNFAERYASFDSFYHFVKHRLKAIGAMIGCPDITLYWARYSWATYASKIDIPDSTISKALGHAESSLAEKKYISFDWEKVDNANRKVIDYALYRK
jgi:integrase